MAERSAPLVNFAGGLLSKKLTGRIDLPSYAIGSLIVRNFLPEVQGPRTFRPGFRYVLPTRNNEVTLLLPFIFNDEQAYNLAFSEKKMRVLSDGGVVTEDGKTITGITKANPGVVSVSAHGFADGDQVYISGVEGMTELNDKFYLVDYGDAGTFSLKDLDGNAINTSGFGAYTAGGTVERVYEINTPYPVADLELIKFAQKADIMYIVHPDYEMRKLRRFGETDWRLETFTRTDDPFTKAISGATKANPCVITCTGHGLIDGDLIEIYGVAGMTQLNGNTYKVDYVDANSFNLQDENGNNINSTGYGSYTSGGYLFVKGNMPGAVAFYGGRLLYGGTSTGPEMFWGSRAPEDSGATRFDDFTLGTTAEDAIVYPIASQNNTADRIQWFAGTPKFLAIGTYGAIYKAYGASESAPISGTEVTVVPIDFYGVKSMLPVRIGTAIYYVQRGGLVLNRFAYSIFDDGYSSEDLNILSDEITNTGIKQLAVQQGSLNVVWAVRNDGRLLGLTTKEQEKIAAWHDHVVGGKDVKVLSICGEPQPDNDDDLWAVIERTVNGVTRRSIEYMVTDEPLPEPEDFYTGDKTADRLAFIRCQLEGVKQYVRLDSALIFDSLQNVAVTPDDTTGDGIPFYTDVALFTEADIGRQIVRKVITGYETGIAEITEFVSATEVVCKILEDFVSADPIPAGEWYLATSELSGLEHLEGETVKIVTDGAVHPERTVTNGRITLDYPATVAHVGLGYLGWVKSMPLNPASITGSSLTRTLSINKLGVLFRNSLGTKFGTDEYKLEQVLFRTTNDRTGNPPPLFSGVKDIQLRDGYDSQKFIHIIQDEPLPCTIQALVPYVNVTEE